MPQKMPFFEHRWWSISALHNWKVFDETLARALKEAPRHNITGMEFHDYNGSFVDTAMRFRNYPKLAQAPTLTYFTHKRGPAIRSMADSMELARRYKQAAKMCRDAGLEVQVWYHCFRDWPKEAMQMYPELADADGQALYEYLTDTLNDCFEFFPEIAGITVTSLHETPSILRFSGGTTHADRMHRLYTTLLGACDAHKRRLILRDFSIRKHELDDYNEVVDRLPDHVVLETKCSMQDWASHEKPLNPNVTRYAMKKKKLLVEFDISNNFAGEMEIPWCIPDHIWRRVRMMAGLGAAGGIGWLVNTDEVTAGTIFDTPNEVNVWALSRFLQDPGKLLVDPDDEWDREYDQMDMSCWTDWAKLRFGEKAAAEVVEILRRSGRVCELTFNICGGYFFWCRYADPAGKKEHMKRSIYKPYSHFQSATRAVRRCGYELARLEKAEAARLVEDALERVEKLKKLLAPEGYENLHGSFMRARHIVGIYRAMCEAFLLALEVDAGREDRKTLLAATAKLRAKADETSAAYGENLFEGTPRGARAVAEFLEEVPGRVEEILKISGHD